MSGNPISVVAAVCARGDEFLVTRRQRGVHLEGLWEFPGGKVHPGERHEEALRREMLEELAASVAVGDLLLANSHDYPDRTIELFFYRCTLLGTPQPMLGQDVRWVARRDLPSLQFPPADEALIRLLSGTATT